MPKSTKRISKRRSWKWRNRRGHRGPGQGVKRAALAPCKRQYRNSDRVAGLGLGFFGVVIGLAILVSVSATGFAEQRLRRRPTIEPA